MTRPRWFLAWLVTCLCPLLDACDDEADEARDGASGHDATAADASADAAPIRYQLDEFTKVPLSDEFRAEGAAFADLDRDGDVDIIAGPFWYAGPDWQTRWPYDEGPIFDGRTGYSNNFFAFSDDLDDDGWQDILIVGFPGRETHWFKNPGPPGEAKWERHLVLERTDNESPSYVDLTGDGRRELVCVFDGKYGYATPVPGQPQAPWRWHPISAAGPWQAFTHGMGVGDVDGDGLLDVIEKDGWWQQPPSLAADPIWPRHEFRFADAGGAQMFAHDLDGDGDNDVVTSLAAHGFGLAWFEQRRKSNDITFERHLLSGEAPDDSLYGVRFGEPHALAMADLDGDGVLDIITGERFWSHGPEGDLEPERAPLYWFRTSRGPNGIELVPQLIDDDSGVGTQVTVGDVDGDHLDDILIANKKGVFVFRHSRRTVSRDEWQAAQPPRR